MRSASLTFLITWILHISFITLLIVAILYSTMKLERSSSVILRYAPNISNVKINPFNPIILLIAFTTICNQFTLNNFKCFFITIL